MPTRGENGKGTDVHQTEHTNNHGGNEFGCVCLKVSRCSEHCNFHSLHPLHPPLNLAVGMGWEAHLLGQILGPKWAGVQICTKLCTQKFMGVTNSAVCISESVDTSTCVILRITFGWGGERGGNGGARMSTKLSTLTIMGATNLAVCVSKPVIPPNNLCRAASWEAFTHFAWYLYAF